MKRYDPKSAPAPEAWLGLDEGLRIELAAAFHREEGVEMPNLTVHAVVHAIVENQIALAQPDVVETLARLQREGLDRHEAVHAIGSVLVDHLQQLLGAETAGGEQENRGYFAALRDLSAETWLRRG